MYTHTVQWKECDKLVLKKYWMFYKLVAFICLYTHRGRLFSHEYLISWSLIFCLLNINAIVMWYEMNLSRVLIFNIWSCKLLSTKLPLAHDFNFDKIIYIYFGAQLVWKKDLKKKFNLIFGGRKFMCIFIKCPNEQKLIFVNRFWMREKLPEPAPID